MEYLKWIFLFLFFLLILIGLKDGIKGFFSLWVEHGLRFSILTAIFFILFLAPSLTKNFAPQYYDASIIVLILYVIGLLIYRFGFIKEGSN